MPAASDREGSPMLGGSRRQRDPALWAALLGRDDRRRQQAARTIRALEQDRWYARQLVDALPALQPWQRIKAGDALSLLGDIRFSPPFFLPEMIPVPAGVAILGSPDYPDELPVHAVETSAFALAQYPVTQLAYAVFVAETRHRSPRGWRRGQPDPLRRNAPVVHVSARDAESYCGWLSDQTGHTYRLPTEAEWVLAARGDGERRVFPWGNTFDASQVNAWDDTTGGQLCAVGLFPEGRGPYGHDDLAGNVLEWCSSLCWPYPYRPGDGREDPLTNTEARVVHGGSWRSRPSSLRCAARQAELPTDSFDVAGFRLARDA